MVKSIFSLLVASLLVTACSGGGGGSSSSSSSAGFIGAPSATCKGAACVPGATISFANVKTMSVNVDRAVDVYEGFNNVFIPRLNDFLAKVYAAMVAGGSESCSDVVAGSGTVNGYSFTITKPTSETIPSGFTKASSTFDYSIEAAVSGSNVAQIHVRCGDETTSDPLTVKALVKETDAQYEFVYEKSGNHIRIMGAGIRSSDRMIAWFKTDDGDDFDLAIKSNVNSITDSYLARGSKLQDLYNISDDGNSTSTCVTGSGGSGTCTSFSINTPPTLSVSDSTDWADTSDITSFTIADP